MQLLTVTATGMCNLHLFLLCHHALTKTSFPDGFIITTCVFVSLICAGLFLHQACLIVEMDLCLISVAGQKQFLKRWLLRLEVAGSRPNNHIPQSTWWNTTRGFVSQSDKKCFSCLVTYTNGVAKYSSEICFS